MSEKKTSLPKMILLNLGRLLTIAALLWICLYPQPKKVARRPARADFMTTYAIVRKAIAKTLAVNIDKIGLTTSFKNDLGVDEAYVRDTLGWEMAEQMKVEFDTDLFARQKTVGDVVNYLQECMANSEPEEDETEKQESSETETEGRP